jgi:hypothetical protein
LKVVVVVVSNLMRTPATGHRPTHHQPHSYYYYAWGWLLAVDTLIPFIVDGIAAKLNDESCYQVSNYHQ